MGKKSLDTMFDELTAIAQKTDPSITREMVECWVGNDGYGETQREWMERALDELETGEYTARELAEDVTQLSRG